MPGLFAAEPRNPRSIVPSTNLAISSISRFQRWRFPSFHGHPAAQAPSTAAAACPPHLSAAKMPLRSRRVRFFTRTCEAAEANHAAELRRYMIDGQPANRLATALKQQCAKPKGITVHQTMPDHQPNTTIHQANGCANVGPLSRSDCNPRKAK